MAKLTPIERLQSDIAKILEEYSDDVDRKSGECVKKVAQKGAKALRSSSPGGGKYAKGWTSQVETSRFETTATIYNRTPGLPHLLEHGHVISNGTGRTFGNTAAIEHIAPVEQDIIEEFQKTLEAELV